MKNKRWMACALLLLVALLLAQACAPRDVKEDEPAAEPKPVSATKPAAESKPAKGSGGLWDHVPIMDGATLDNTTECPAKWTECAQCEHRIYVTDATAQEICDFYKEQMPKNGWMKLVYQYYPEGSCMGTWMDGETRVLLTGGVRAGDKKVFVAITVGNDCP